MNFNSIILAGNLTRSPELRRTPNGTAVAVFPLAYNDIYYDSNKSKVSRTYFFNIVVWGKKAETCSQYLSKGSGVLIQGRLTNRTYEDRDGVKRTATEIIADLVQFVGGKPNGNNSTPPPEPEDYSEAPEPMSQCLPPQQESLPF